MMKRTNVSSTEHCLTMKAVHPGPNGIHRDALFDNARFLLIGLIILSHCMERIWLRNIYIFSLYQYLFMLHIPCLAMISGYFSTQELSFHLLYRMARQLLVPFIVFEAAYRIFIWQIPIPDLTTFMPPYVDERIPFVSPFWLMWYLLSLFRAFF